MRKFTIEYIQKLAENRNGECLSDKYIDCKTKLTFKCNKDGCVWTAISDNIKRGTWCPECGKIKLANSRKYSIEYMQKIAKERDGECLSKIYTNSKTKLLFKCNKDGNEWFSTPKNICRGCWCQTCSTNKKKYTIIEIRQIAEKRNGKCLSNKYKHNHSLLKWQCNKDGCVWNAHLSSIINNGSWCPECSSFKTERLCRKILETKTGYKFIKSKPKWLNGLELDGYCNELKLAFEYNGIQHHQYVPYFHRSKQDFIDQLKRDKLKNQLCIKNNIRLINIPHNYTFNNIPRLTNYIEINL